MGGDLGGEALQFLAADVARDVLTSRKDDHPSGRLPTGQHSHHLTPTVMASGCFYSECGSEAQPWHTDGPALARFVDLSPYAVNIFIPLVDLGPHNGTQFAVGSHRPNDHVVQLAEQREAQQVEEENRLTALMAARREKRRLAALRKVEPSLDVASSSPQAGGGEPQRPSSPLSPLCVNGSQTFVAATGRNPQEVEVPVSLCNDELANVSNALCGEKNAIAGDHDDDDDVSLLQWSERRAARQSSLNGSLTANAGNEPSVEVTGGGGRCERHRDVQDCDEEDLPLVDWYRARQQDEGRAQSALRRDESEVTIVKTESVAAKPQQSNIDGEGASVAYDAELRDEADVPKSYRLVAPVVRVGEALLFDYRVWHRGLGNRGNYNRPCLYTTMVQPWYVDSYNFDPRRYNSRLRIAEVFRASAAERLAARRLQQEQHHQLMEDGGLDAPSTQVSATDPST